MSPPLKQQSCQNEHNHLPVVQKILDFNESHGFFDSLVNPIHEVFSPTQILEYISRPSI